MFNSEARSCGMKGRIVKDLLSGVLRIGLLWKWILGTLLLFWLQKSVEFQKKILSASLEKFNLLPQMNVKFQRKKHFCIKLSVGTQSFFQFCTKERLLQGCGKIGPKINFFCENPNDARASVARVVCFFMNNEKGFTTINKSTNPDPT